MAPITTIPAGLLMRARRDPARMGAMPLSSALESLLKERRDWAAAQLQDDPSRMAESILGYLDAQIVGMIGAFNVVDAYLAERDGREET